MEGVFVGWGVRGRDAGAVAVAGTGDSWADAAALLPVGGGAAATVEVGGGGAGVADGLAEDGAITGSLAAVAGTLRALQAKASDAPTPIVNALTAIAVGHRRLGRTIGSPTLSE